MQGGCTGFPSALCNIDLHRVFGAPTGILCLQREVGSGEAWPKHVNIVIPGATAALRLRLSLFLAARSFVRFRCPGTQTKQTPRPSVGIQMQRNMWGQTGGRSRWESQTKRRKAVKGSNCRGRLGGSSTDRCRRAVHARCRTLWGRRGTAQLRRYGVEGGQSCRAAAGTAFSAAGPPAAALTSWPASGALPSAPEAGLHINALSISPRSCLRAVLLEDTRTVCHGLSLNLHLSIRTPLYGTRAVEKHITLLSIRKANVGPSDCPKEERDRLVCKCRGPTDDYVRGGSYKGRGGWGASYSGEITC